MARLLAVAPTDEEAREIARAGAAWTIGAYANAEGGAIGVPAGPTGFGADVESGSTATSTRRSCGVQRHVSATSWPASPNRCTSAT